MKLLDKFLNYLDKRALSKRIERERSWIYRTYLLQIADAELGVDKKYWRKKARAWVSKGRPVTIYDENGTPHRYREGDVV